MAPNNPTERYHWYHEVDGMERDVPYTELQRGWAALLGWHRWDGEKNNHRKPFWWKLYDGSTVQRPIISGSLEIDSGPDISIIYCYDPADLFRHEGVPNPEDKHEDNIQVARLPAE